MMQPMTDEGKHSLWRLSRRDWLAAFKATAREFKEDDVSVLSAAVTYRIVLSLVPSLIAAVAITALVIEPAQLQRLVNQLGDVVPESSLEFIRTRLDDVIDSLRSGTVGIAGVAGGLVAASSAAVVLIKALNRVYDVDDDRKLVRQRLVSLVVMASLVLAMAGVFVALVLGPSLVESLLPAVLESPLRPLVTVGRYAAAVVVLIAFFGALYWIAPNRPDVPLTFLTPGAVLGVVGWLLLSFGFSVYVSNFGSYNQLYGAVAGIVVLLIWLNYSFIVLLMGAELNHEIEKLVLARARGGATEDEQQLAHAHGRPAAVGAATPHLAAASPTRGLPPSDGTGDAADRSDRPGGVPIPVLSGAARSIQGSFLATAIWRKATRR